MHYLFYRERPLAIVAVIKCLLEVSLSYSYNFTEKDSVSMEVWSQMIQNIHYSRKEIIKGMTLRSRENGRR